MPDRLLVTVPDDRWTGLWPTGEGPVDVALWDTHGDAPGRPALVVLPYMSPPDYDRLTATGARVWQLLSAGYDSVLPRVPDGVVLANARGVHDSSTAELAVGLAIAGRRGFGDFARAMPSGTWLAGTRTSLADSRVLLVGTGSVGAAVAARLVPFEVELTRVGTRARDDEHGHVHGVAELPALLPHHDVVILVVPLSESTRGLVDAAFLAAMPDGALLVNVARGPVVVTDALVAELTAGRLRAALDVTDPEPLPPGHPLWTAPHVIVSPHVGGDTTAFPRRARALLAEQFARLADGRELLNVVGG